MPKGLRSRRRKKESILYRFQEGFDIDFGFPKGSTKDDDKKITLRDIIWDLQDTAVPSGEKNHRNPEAINNNEYYTGAYSPIFMSRNRVKGWDEPGIYSSGIRKTMSASSTGT